MNTEDTSKPTPLQGWLSGLKTKQASLAQMEEEHLVGEVIEADKYLMQERKRIQEHDRYSVVSALTIGYALQVLKDKHKDKRDWVAFLDTKLPILSTATVYRYLALAKRFPDPDKVPLTLSITAAYRLSAILPDAETNSAGKELGTPKTKSPEKLIKSIGALVTSLGSSVEANPEQPQDRTALAKMLQELIENLRKIHAWLIPGANTPSDPHQPANPPRGMFDPVPPPPQVSSLKKQSRKK